MPDFLPKACNHVGCTSGKLALHGESYCPDHIADKGASRRKFDAHRREIEPWRAWYLRKPWTGKNGLRVLVLNRDPVCVKCNRNASTVVDHIIDHKGNWNLFIAYHKDRSNPRNNLQGLCKQCHDEKTANEVVAARKKLEGE